MIGLAITLVGYFLALASTQVDDQSKLYFALRWSALIFASIGLLVALSSLL